MYALRRLEMHMTCRRQSKKSSIILGFGYLCYLKLYVTVNSSQNVLNRNKPIVLKNLRPLAQYDGACLHSQHRESKSRCQSYL